MRVSSRLTAVLHVLPLLSILLTGCAAYTSLPAGTVKQFDRAPVIEQQTVSVPVPEPTPPPSADYQVGPGDILGITVYGRPDLSSFAGKGSRVDGSGNIQLPMVGIVHVAGLTVEQTRARLQEDLKKYLKEPSVVVEVAEYKSRPLQLLGQFKAPGTHYMDRSYNLLEGIALGSGLDASANLRGARLLRGKKIVPVDIYALLHDGDQRQNVWVQAGDTIYVPDNTLQNVFVFGAVKTPGPIPMKNGQLTLHQAVAAAGGLGETGYDRNIRIIRSLSPTKGELIVVDLDKILAGESRPYPLMEGDIVYVPKDFVANWNQAINEILPTLQAVGAILNPFVQIKFLTRN